MLHISPETYCRRKIFPHAFVFPDTFFTLLDKWFHTIFFDLFFSVQPQFLFYFQLYRKAMGIPACFSRYHVSFHGTVTWNHILDDTGQYVTDMRFSVCCRRSVIKCVGFSLFSLFHTFFKNMIFLPELFCLFLSVHKVQIG